jgi:hypothetical protein
MKNIAIALCTASLLFGCKTETKVAANADSTTATATTTPAKAEEWVPVDSATAMKTMMEAGTPGKEQAMLAKSNGTWKAETTMWMAPDAPPMKSMGTATNKMILGGRYQQMTFKGDMMGSPFEGVGTTAYDNARKTWTSTWVDNMSTAILNMEGTWDEATKTMTSTGKMICPGNGKMCEMKEVLKMVDDNTQVMEMYGPDMKTGKQYKNMEIKLTRSK